MCREKSVIPVVRFTTVKKSRRSCSSKPNRLIVLESMLKSDVPRGRLISRLGGNDMLVKLQKIRLDNFKSLVDFDMKLAAFLA